MIKEKSLAITLYLSGLSMNAIAQIIGTTAQSVMRWIKNKAHELPKEQPQITGPLNVEIDEMHHYIAKKTKTLDLESTRSLEILLSKFDCESVKFYTDHYNAYGEILPYDKLIQTKAKTHSIERNNGQQRHWLARFRRRSIVVTKSLEILNASLALFAHFRVNIGIHHLSAFFR